MTLARSLIAFTLPLALAAPALAQRQVRTQVRVGPESRPAETAQALAHNYYGAHLLIDNAAGKNEKQLRWARYLVGRWGYAKTLFYNIDHDTKGPASGWVDYVKACYKLELIPVIRLGGRMEKGTWVKPKPDAPGDYGTLARAIRRVVEDLPRSDKCPLYIELWNEPNLAAEWSGQPDPAEYAAFFVQAAKAIHDLRDPRIHVLNGGLATSPDWVEKLCAAQPEFIRSFDLWASHPYPGNRPPWKNLHNKAAPAGSGQTIDAYLPELDVLQRLGLSNPQVMLTETGYELGNGFHARSEGLPIIDEYNRADYMVRAFRDYYPQWPEVVAVLPFEFCGQGWERFDWVYPDSNTNPDGSPSHPHYQYAAIAALAKPTDTTGAISGTIKAAGLDLRLDNVTVTIPTAANGRFISDPMGNYFFAKLAPGSYRVALRRTGFKDMSKTVAVKAAANAVLDLEMAAERHETLRGVVCGGDDDRPLADVKLTVHPGGLVVKTNSTGEYIIRDLVPARYRLTAEATGRYVYDADNASIVAGRTNTFDFRLGKLPAHLPGGNLLNNASMESGGGGAGKSGLALGFEPAGDQGAREENTRINERLAHTGRCCQEMKVNPEETVVRQITNYNSAVPGERYVAGVWIRADTGAGAAWMTLDFTDNAGVSVGQLKPKERVTGHSRGWNWVEVGGLAPRNAQRLSIGLHTQGRGGQAYFDDACIGQAAGKK